MAGEGWLIEFTSKQSRKQTWKRTNKITAHTELLHNSLFFQHPSLPRSGGVRWNHVWKGRSARFCQTSQDGAAAPATKSRPQRLVGTQSLPRNVSYWLSHTVFRSLKHTHTLTDFHFYCISEYFFFLFPFSNCALFSLLHSLFCSSFIKYLFFLHLRTLKEPLQWKLFLWCF